MSSFAADPRPSQDNAPAWTRLVTPLRVVLLGWIVALVWYLRAKGQDIPLLTTFDPDDSLRLVQVRDLLGGQGWWDVSQHRINPLNGGGLMHWSRIVDTPIALGIWALTPLLGRPVAEYVWIALWPMLLLLAMLWVMTLVCRRLGDWRLAYVAPLLVLTNVIILYQFVPLRIDHHGWQSILSLAAVGLATVRDPRRGGLFAALACATLIAISLEGLPMVALIAAIFAIEWWWTGQQDAARRLDSYLATLTVVAIFWQFVTRGPSGLTSDWCDSLSRPYIAAFAIAAIAIAGGTRLAATQLGTRWRRLLYLALCGAASLTVLLVVAPDCIHGPFGQLDPVVRTYWYDNVREGQPIWRFWDVFAVANIAPSLLGMVGTIVGWRMASDADQRRAWLIWASILAGIFILSLLVNRTSALAQLMATPGLAMLAIVIFTRARRLTFVPLRIVATAAAAIVIPPVIGSLAVAAVTFVDPSMVRTRSASSARTVCGTTDRSTATLAQLPPTLLFAPLDLGPDLLKRTPHSVLATGHHRNNAIMAQVLNGFLAPSDRAEALVRAQHTPVVVACPGANEFRNLMLHPGPSLAKDLDANRPPPWLEPIPLGPNTGLRAWRVVASPTNR